MEKINNVKQREVIDWLIKHYQTIDWRDCDRGFKAEIGEIYIKISMCTDDYTYYALAIRNDLLSQDRCITTNDTEDSYIKAAIETIFKLIDEKVSFEKEDVFYSNILKELIKHNNN